MNPIDQAQKNLNKIAQALPIEYLKSIGAANLTVASERTVRFDITPTATGINRVKVTVQPNGELRVRTYKVEEIEDVPGVEPDNLVAAISMLTGLTNPPALPPITLQ